MTLDVEDCRLLVPIKYLAGVVNARPFDTDRCGGTACSRGALAARHVTRGEGQRPPAGLGVERDVQTGTPGGRRLALAGTEGPECLIREYDRGPVMSVGNNMAFLYSSSLSIDGAAAPSILFGRSAAAL
ncbi:unnamed protein product [Boreogadus saida]